MLVFLFTLAIISMLVVGMSVGVLMGRKPISGTCGGMSALGMGGDCDVCGGDPEQCDNGEEAAGKALAGDPDLGMDIMAGK